MKTLQVPSLQSAGLVQILAIHGHSYQKLLSLDATEKYSHSPFNSTFLWED